jgi:hypothetical protein
MDTTKESRPAYGREIGRELFGSLVLPIKGGWRSRYVWWMQYLEVAVFVGLAFVVWQLSGGTPDDPWALGPWWVVAAVFVGTGMLCWLIEAEARVTERRLERRRQTEAGGRLDIPDGYVLAYELGNQAGQLGAELADPFLVVAAISADRWDLTEPLWRFTLRASSLGGLVVQLSAGNIAGVQVMRGFFAELKEGQLDDLTAAERALAARGARDVTSAFLPEDAN